MILPPTFALKLLTTLADVESGPKWVAVELATGQPCYTFSRLSITQIRRFLERGGGTVAGTVR